VLQCVAVCCSVLQFVAVCVVHVCVVCECVVCALRVFCVSFVCVAKKRPLFYVLQCVLQCQKRGLFVFPSSMSFESSSCCSVRCGHNATHTHCNPRCNTFFTTHFCNATHFHLVAVRVVMCVAAYVAVRVRCSVFVQVDASKNKPFALASLC